MTYTDTLIFPMSIFKYCVPSLFVCLFVLGNFVYPSRDVESDITILFFKINTYMMISFLV